MKGSHRKRGMAMPMRSPVRMRWGIRSSMDMHMNVRAAVVLMRVRMDVIRPGPSQSPDAYSDQHDSNESLCPRRHLLDGKESSQAKQERTYENDTRRMPESPSKSRPPGVTMAMCGQRRDRHQMIRPGEDMNQPRHQSCKKCYQESRPSLIRPQVELIPPGVRLVAKRYGRVSLADATLKTLRDPKSVMWLGKNDEGINSRHATAVECHLRMIASS